MTDELDEALEARLRHFLRGAAVARTMRTQSAQEGWMQRCMESAVRDIRKLCQDAQGAGVPARVKLKKGHLGLLNGAGGGCEAGEGQPQEGPKPELRLVE